MKTILDIYNSNKLVLLIFICSLIAYFCKKTCPTIENSKFINEILLALITGAIFYLFTSGFTIARQKKVIKNYVIKRYCDIKFDLLSNCLQLHEDKSRKKITKEDRERIKENINNYNIIQEYFTDDVLCNIKTYYPDSNFLKETMFLLNQLKECFIALSAYEFIQVNSRLYERLLHFISWVQNITFLANIDETTSTERGTFDTALELILANVLTGWDMCYGQRKSDDLFELIRDC
ncbi:hypothetical protein [Legionella feeleii]|uniref:Uncharacterized protein n=1 Tax=Legionella feeleii TaxID=453 RepID=A0A0W0U329_9GAMM|nr:hypothetical protein [Legionella feeleii]KTD02023.1 hypothetical protein Lfee_0868 [Legionella feeleii]SPX59894.1 Uncharacterised protein [Legionella feeleii]